MPSTTVFPGFTALSDQVFVREGSTNDTSEAPNPSHPKTVIIYGWGDALPKHVAKYTDGFRKLFPHARQIAVLAPIYRAMWESLEQRADRMKPVLDAAFGGQEANREKERQEGGQEGDNSILIHVMSNTGGMNYAATLYAYTTLFDRPLPHRLTVFDSTPGSVEMTLSNLKRMSLAMALGTAGWFPWPFVVTQGIWGAFLYGVHILQYVTGKESAPFFSTRAVKDPKFQTLQAKRVHLYSKADKIILWSDIEEYIADSRRLGYKADGVLFEGSDHVGHMRLHSEQYWKAIQVAWMEGELSSN